MSSPLKQYIAMTEHLAKLYPSAQLFERGNLQHPAVILSPTDAQRDDIDSVLGAVPATTEDPDTFAAFDHGYLNSLKNSGRHLFNGLTYSFHKIRLRPLTITARIGRYFDMIATSGALEQELRDTVANGGLIRLPMRSQLHRAIDPERALVDGVGRSAALGGGVLTVFKHEGHYQAILARRTARSAMNAGFYHVLPAFMFQPLGDTPRDEHWRLSDTIYREWLEELFAMPEVLKSDVTGMAEHPALVDLKAMMARGDASLHMTGIVINLMTLRPEFCALLIIHDADWYTRVTAPDSPYPLNVTPETDDGKLKRVPVADDETVLKSLPEDIHALLPPHASAAFWLGLDLTRQLMR